MGAVSRHPLLITVVVLHAVIAGCRNSDRSIEVTHPDQAGTTGSTANGQTTGSGNASSSNYSSSSLYTTDPSAGKDLLSELPKPNSSITNGLSTNSGGTNPGLSPNDPRPPSAGMSMALQLLPQLLGCLQQQCNPLGMVESFVTPMLSKVPGIGGQAGSIVQSLIGQASSLFQAGGDSALLDPADTSDELDEVVP
jgi:hypothetical protein